MEYLFVSGEVFVYVQTRCLGDSFGVVQVKYNYIREFGCFCLNIFVLPCPYRVSRRVPSYLRVCRIAFCLGQGQCQLLPILVG